MKEIIESNNWYDFKRNISELTSKGRGDAFELLVKYYLISAKTSITKKCQDIDNLKGHLCQDIDNPF